MTNTQTEFENDAKALEVELHTLGMGVRLIQRGELCYCMMYGCECWRAEALDALAALSAERPLDDEERHLVATLQESLRNAVQPEAK